MALPSSSASGSAASSPPPPLSTLTSRQVSWIGAGYLLTLSSLPGQTIFIAQFNAALRETFSLSHGEFGGLYTIATLASSLCLIWAGGLADRYSPRLLGLVCIGALALTMVFTSQVTSVLALGVALFGLRFFGQGMLVHIALTAMARWFSRFRGRALSLAQMGQPTGEAVLPFLTTIAIVAFGWRQVWLVAASVLVLLVAPLVAFMLRAPPDGRRALVAGTLNPDRETHLKPAGKQWTRARVFRDPMFYLVVAGLMGPAAIGTLYIFNQAHLADIKGWDITVFTAFFPVFALSIVVTSIVSGMLVDRYGAWRIMPFLLVPEGLGTLGLAYLDAIWTIPGFFIAFGMTTGMMSPVVGALWAEIYGTAHIGKIRALATSAMVLASAIGPGFAGVLIDLGFDLDRQGFIYAAYCFGVAGLIFVVRKHFGKRAEIISEEQREGV